LARSIPELDYLFGHSEKSTAAVKAAAGKLKAVELQGTLLTGGIGESSSAGEGSDIYKRAKNAETLVGRQLTRNLRDVHFEPQAMDVAYRWRIEATVILKENGYTFFD